MKPFKHHKRKGFSFLELTVTAALMATVLTSVFVLMRTARQNWESYNADQPKIEAAENALRHIVRKIRQSDSVTAISAAANTSGSLSLMMADGSTWNWSRSVNQILFNTNGGSNSVLCDNIGELSFVAYKKDGTTTTTTVAEIRLIKVTVKTTLTKSNGVTRTLTCYAWRRSF